MLYLLFSKYCPSNPSIQLHEYEAIPSTHVELFVQLFETQSSISKNNSKTFQQFIERISYQMKVTLRHHLEKKWLNLENNLERTLYLLLSQYWPSYPSEQLHEYEAIPSTHVELFVQLFEMQSSISK